MKLRHATPTRNLRSIRKRGLLTAKSKGRMSVVWLHTASRSLWACLHTMRRHGCTFVTVIEVDIPRSWLTRSKAGLWYTNRDVPPCRIKRTIAVDED
ncbi:MAG TPA: hypothetical protein VH643_11680 [Gemmataceae bacterium]|jgi:hypothetical protein